MRFLRNLVIVAVALIGTAFAAACLLRMYAYLYEYQWGLALLAALLFCASLAAVHAVAGIKP